MAREVYVGGKLLARAGNLLTPIAPAAGVTPPRDTLQIALRADDFILRVQAFVTASPACAISAARASPSGAKWKCRFVTGKSSYPPASV